MSEMFNPPHPGRSLASVIDSLGLTIAQAAEQLGVNRVTLSRILNERGGISAEMALRIQAWLGIENGGSAELWIGNQIAYDMWQARKEFKRARIKVKPAPRPVPWAEVGGG